MTPINIRKATVKDIAKLLEFEQGIFLAERPLDPTLKEEKAFYYDIEKMILAEGVEILVAEIALEVVGSGYARIVNAEAYLKYQTYAYLGFMYTDSNHRGKGINSKIIQALKDWCISKNIKELRLDVYSENPSAIRAYEKEGFQN